MTRLAFLLWFISGAAFGDDYKDVLETRQIAWEMQVYYANSLAQSSGNVDEVRAFENGVEVHIQIEVNTGSVEGGKERLTVTPVTPGYIAIPPSVLVKDGDNTTVFVLPLTG